MPRLRCRLWVAALLILLATQLQVASSLQNCDTPPPAAHPGFAKGTIIKFSVADLTVVNNGQATNQAQDAVTQAMAYLNGVLSELGIDMAIRPAQGTETPNAYFRTAPL